MVPSLRTDEVDWAPAGEVPQKTPSSKALDTNNCLYVILLGICFWDESR